MKVEAGFTYIQIMVAISVAAILTIAFQKGLQQDVEAVNLETVDLTVTALHHSVESYYDSRCQSGSVSSPTISQLVSEGHLYSASAVTLPAFASFSDISIVSSGASGAVFRYTVAFQREAQAIKAASHSVYATQSGRNVIWEVASSTNNNSTTSESSEYLRAFGGSSC